MITAEEALGIADLAAIAEKWGRVDDSFHAVLSGHEPNLVWNVSRRRVVIGYDFWFSIDGETGTILDKGRRGTR
jgi:hypothetical protein